MMNGNQKINQTKILDTNGPNTSAMRIQPQGQNNTNTTVVMDSKTQHTPVSRPKVQFKPVIGSSPHDQKISPTAVECVKVQPKPVLGSGKEVGHRVPEQKISPLAADTESQSLASNVRANISQPYIRITPPHKKITQPLVANPSKKGFNLKACICWTFGIIFLLLLILGAIVGIIYLVFKPKIPDYSVDSLSISDLRLNLDLSLYAKFDVKITATNPNKKIGIYYRKGSKLSVWYTKTKLCQGTLPIFYQGHENRTKINVALTGQNQYGSTLMAALQEQQQTGRIPLDLKVDVPVNIKLGGLKLRKIRILGTCLLTVDNLSANSFITIKASTCKFRAKL